MAIVNLLSTKFEPSLGLKSLFYFLFGSFNRAFSDVEKPFLFSFLAAFKLPNKNIKKGFSTSEKAPIIVYPLAQACICQHVFFVFYKKKTMDAELFNP